MIGFSHTYIRAEAWWMEQMISMICMCGTYTSLPAAKRVQYTAGKSPCPRKGMYVCMYVWRDLSEGWYEGILGGGHIHHDDDDDDDNDGGCIYIMYVKPFSVYFGEGGGGVRVVVKLRKKRLTYIFFQFIRTLYTNPLSPSNSLFRPPPPSFPLTTNPPAPSSQQPPC